ncbi:Apulose-4-phosphate transketolase subunit A [Azospirillaceae bacterium]
MTKEVSDNAPQLARRLKAHVLRMVHHANASHVGSCLSSADIVAVLYHSILRVFPEQPEHPDRDRFILSKGHAAALLYAALAERGFFPRDWLERYCEDGAPLAGHATRHGAPGVEVSTGSLGHGLPIGCGMAWAARHDRRSSRVFVLLSDGEMDEGSNWEAVLFAGHQKLAGLTAIIDFNGLQGFGAVNDVLNLEPLVDKFRACRWTARDVDGHDHAALEAALAAPADNGAPTVVIARTIKGKGVGFMEGRLEWHYRSPKDEDLRLALKEIGE